VVGIGISQYDDSDATRNTRSRTHPYEKLKDDDVCKVRRTNSTFPDSKHSQDFRYGVRIDYPDFPGGCWFLLFVSFNPFSSKQTLEKERKKEGSDRSERLIKMIGFNIVLGL